MAVKPRFNQALEDKANERIDKQISRIYLVWVIGIVMGAIRLKLEKFEYGGLSFTPENSEKLQGIIFLVCIFMYIAMIGIVLLLTTQFVTTDRALKRRVLYGALDHKKTLIGRDKGTVYVFKKKARVLYFFMRSFLILAFFLPLFHIVFFQQAVLLTGVDAILHTDSVENGQIKLLAPVPFILTFILMTFWTIMVQRSADKLIGVKKGIDRVIFANGLALVSFAFLDSWFRGQESFTDAALREVPIQMMIASFYAVPTVLIWPFMLWFWLASLPARLRKFRGK
jgi:hypothetical protein